ncbi:hypothetical protein [Ruegeria lacuscaerulensis]|uniref:hypothetical protein n=1 Tax=Ruegeria lacuscaerulensis TaxID=55218 RepID=UPI00147E9E3F|nr:hypothetical protein [Ruegeria lacuscaerulensis]
MDHLETWLDDRIPGLFARIATIRDASDTTDDVVSDALTAVWNLPGSNRIDPSATPPHIPGFNTWDEVVGICRRVAISWPDLAASGGVSDAKTVRTYHAAAERLLPDLVDSVIAAGELRISVDASDLLFRADALTVRAHLANEMLAALRDGWRWMQCSYCGGWHRIQRARDTSYCSNRCKTAAHRERQTV